MLILCDVIEGPLDVAINLNINDISSVDEAKMVPLLSEYLLISAFIHYNAL